MSGRHGTSSNYKSGCRCELCRAAAAKARQEWLIAKNGGKPFRVRPDKAMRHLAYLRSHGVSLKAISAASGISEVGLRHIPKTKSGFILASTENAILGVTISDDSYVPGWKVRRLISEMERCGVELPRLADAMMVTTSSIRLTLGQRKHKRRTLKRIETVYTYLAKQGSVPASVLEDIA